MHVSWTHPLDSNVPADSVDMSVKIRNPSQINRDSEGRDAYSAPGSVSKHASGGEYIPAYHSSGRRNQEVQPEAGDVNDAELDSRIAGRYERAYMNYTFDDMGKNISPVNVARSPAPVKMNNLFDDTPVSPRSTTTPRAPTTSRLKSTTGTSAATPVQELGPQAWDDPDEVDHSAVVNRPRGNVPESVRDKAIMIWESELKRLIESKNSVDAMYRPAPSEGLVKCYVKRVKSFFGHHPSFQLHLENGDVFLLAARRRKKSKVSSYVVSLDPEDTHRESANCIAKLKANFVGTEYMLWGRGADSMIKKGFSREEVAINFKQTALTTKGGPRTLYMAVPVPEVNWQPTQSDGSDSLVNCLELARTRELPPFLEKKLVLLANKPPEWDDNLRAFTLDFGGRVKEASVKNLQLVHWDHNTDRKGADVVIQFGKISEDMYAMDFSYPLNVQTAFAVALASIDTKLVHALG